MKITKRDAIRIAIAYGEVFDYPLTEEEIITWAPFCVIRTLPAVLQGESLKMRKRLIAIRNKRRAWSEKKWIRARRVAKFLKIIPTITLVGVTGGLTRSNAGDADDIDFLIITTPKTLWVTRGFSTILLDLFGLRRRPSDIKLRNLICLNMFMSEDGLRVPPKERDLFTAHEVLLMTPLWERDGIYKRFLYANAWVKKFLPNAWEERRRNYELRIMNYGKHMSYELHIFSFILHTSYFILRLVEPFVKHLQLFYMKSRRTTEVVTDYVIRFHPRDARVWIKRKLGERLTRFNVPLDKIFYGR